MVLATAVYAKSAKPGQDFFPLTVNYQEKFYAAGKIPGSFPRREGAPSQKETLTSRLIDRPIRPLFPEEFLNEVQIVCTVISHDMVNSPDIIAMIGSSAALTISGIPFMGPIAGARVGYINNEYVINPTLAEQKDFVLDLVVAGTTEGVLMVESEAQQLSEDVMLGAVMAGWKAFQPVIQGIIDLAEMCAKDPWDVPEVKQEVKDLYKALKTDFEKDLAKAYGNTAKAERYKAVGLVRDAAIAKYVTEETSKELVNAQFHKLEGEIVRNAVLDTGKRIDGRTTVDIRQIIAEAGILPRTHGSALFTRGETQALVVTTLGTGQDEQLMDVLEGEYHERFLLHYNFPGFSVGEVSRMSSPGRREIGHGKLAWRAIHQMLPKADEFPYTLRVVSEITESNGSSSMATVCGASLALMDAGVPLGAPVAGIAMGLIKEGEKFAVLSDILGDEDHLGDMDFKVAGTEKGVTALQMDIKITSITEEIMKIALAQAQKGRIHILGEMSKALKIARSDVRDTAPKMTVLKIPVDKIREVIGTGGKVIRDICEKSGAKVDIEDDGTIKVAATDTASADIAIAMIKGITEEAELGKIYTGKVVKTADFGAFVNFMGAKDGLVHISELAAARVNKTTDVVKEGDVVKVKLIGFDERGKVKLSMKRVDQATGLEIEQPKKEAKDDEQAA
jgi:polyribonucleotide nucleotidyltransferase